MPAPSPRAELARLSLAAALAHPDVVAGDPGPSRACVSATESEPLEGVSAVIGPDGTYDVILRLAVRLVPLLPLADDLRRRVRTAAAASASAGESGAIEIQFADVTGERPR